MKKTFSYSIVAALIACALSATFSKAGNRASSGGISAGGAAGSASEEEEYDRLDGMGASGKKVNVIEWEGNLEIHVYPGGSLTGLSLKLDKRNKDKPVMVIGYRFNSDPKKQLIRRAILGIDLAESFKTYRDPSAGSEYDKIVISNNGLSGQMTSFKLDPEPKQLYPDGHPALAAGPDGGKNGYQPRKPASKPEAAQPAATIDEDGGIRHFDF